MCQCLVTNKVTGSETLLKKETPIAELSFEFCETLKDFLTNFEEHLPTNDSDHTSIFRTFLTGK